MQKQAGGAPVPSRARPVGGSTATGRVIEGNWRVTDRGCRNGKKKTRSVQSALRWRLVGNRWQLEGNRWGSHADMKQTEKKEAKHSPGGNMRT